MKSWLKVGLAVALAMSVAYICIHPDFDLLDTVVHSGHDLHAPGFTFLATPIKSDGLMGAASLLLPDKLYAGLIYGSHSLDLICVRLC